MEAHLALRLDPSKILDVNLFAEDFRQGWFEVSAEWSTRAPFYVLMGDEHIVVVNRHAEQTEILLDNEDRFTIVKPPTPEAQRYDLFMGLPVLSNMAGPAHDRLRRLMQPAFGRNGLGFSSTAIEETVEALLDAIATTDGEFDAVREYSEKLLSTILLERMLGFDPEVQAVFIRMSRAMQTVAGGGYTAEYEAAFEDAVRASEQLVAERRRHPTDDFVGRMVSGQEEDDVFTEREIVGNVFGLVGGGLETTANTTTGALLAKTRHPEQFAELSDRPELAAAAVEESLRMHPAGIFTNPRYALVDTEIGGTPILKGMTVLMCVTAGNLDPDQYPDPLRFDIYRDPKHILTFGRGVHFCMGALIARRAAATSLASFMRRFPDFDTVEPDYVPNYQGMWGALSPESLPLRLK